MEDKKKISTEETEKNIEAEKKIDTLDALLLDDENAADDADYYAAQVEFDAFMAEYRTLISKSLSDAAAQEKSKADDQDSKKESPAPASENNAKGKTENQPEETGSSESWDDDITLAPEEYTDLIEEEPKEALEVEEEEKIPDLGLGEETETIGDDFQISISFEGEKTTEPIIVEVEEEEEPAKYDPNKPRAIDWVFDIAEMFVFVLAAVMILTAVLFRHSVVEGGSMLNTLEHGEHLIISDLFYTPERYDIIVFEDYSTTLKKAVVKRVVGLPGETVEIRKADNERRLVVYIDGQPLEEEYAYYSDTGNLKLCTPVTLGENEIFVMGDNRNNSTDSRDLGPINVDAVLGKVIFRFFPFDKFGTVE